MKALSTTQPYATLIAIEAKRVETRSWFTLYRGPVAIHASLKFPREYRDLCSKTPFREALAAAGITSWEQLPLQAVIAIADLYSCLPTKNLRPKLTQPELTFGNYDDGRWGFIWRRGVQRLPEPIFVKGALGLWEWDAKGVIQ